ncbi:hypothetical protein [Enterococcus mundtii]|uniref:hypothetical protein n=1 Tax=Enterococcus mundtii TaxID=53346 RepID=UPI001A96903F|nr:hypothetical protein [Enterococcus mundtii]MBO1087152.1 hypothetical protein [Enterococcus mundtii]
MKYVFTLTKARRKEYVKQITDSTILFTTDIEKAVPLSEETSMSLVRYLTKHLGFGDTEDVYKLSQY